MAKPDEIRKLIGKIGNDPKLIDELLAGHDQNAAKKALEKHKIVAPNEKGPNRQEVQAEINKLLTSMVSQQPPSGAGQRPVEWVAAIGTAAAGAAAGACTQD
jgi:hypothetical protein